MYPTFKLNDETRENFRLIQESTKKLSKRLEEIGAPIQKRINEVGKALRPIIEFYIENEDRIKNFLNDFHKLDKFHNGDINEMPLEYTYEFVQRLVSENKIKINDDGTIDVIEPTLVDSTGNEKSQINIDRIISVIALVVNILTIAPNSDVNIDNSVTNEIHYHISHEMQSGNEYITIENEVNLHSHPKSDSVILKTLPLGQKVNIITTEDNWTLVTVLNEDNEITYSGWLVNDAINPVID